MSRLSVAEAAARLGVSPVRVRQRINDGSLIGEKVGGRWLVDLSVIPRTSPRGRPVDPALVWDAIRRIDTAEQLRHDRGRLLEEALASVYADGWQQPGDLRHAPDLVLPDGSMVEIKVGRSSRRRALHRLTSVTGPAREPTPSSIEALLTWLGARAERRTYLVAGPDTDGLREDQRVIQSGLSHPRSGMQDPRVVEGYVSAADLDRTVEDHWLDPLGVGESPNVFLHVAPGRPSEVTPLMLAADLFEHDGPRERSRAIELASEVFA